MEVFLLISEQQSGPFSLENLHKVHRLGGLPAGALAWCEGQEHWRPVADFLSLHPLPQAQATASPRSRPVRREPSRLRGLAGALVAALIGGAALGGLSVAIGAYFTYAWWPLSWVIGFTASQCARNKDHDQVVGMFACGATFLAIALSLVCIDYRPRMIIIGGLLTIVSFPGSLWLAFRTGSQQS